MSTSTKTTKASRTAPRRSVQGPPAPPPPGALWVDSDAGAGAFGVTLRRWRELRKVPDFPAGRLIGGGGTLRWRLADLLAWADRQPAARFSTVGGYRPGAFGRAEHAA